MTLTVGSLFSGIGGLDLGLERAGMRVIWQSEIDPYACRVLAKHWPTVPNLGDITQIDWSTVERPDVICGGYPCQPFSLAGVRRGESDPRHLWPHFHRSIRHLRPRYALLENVPGHLSLGFDRVLGDLAEIGYDTEWFCLPAAAVGAPHLRWRLFAIATDANGDGHGRAQDGRRVGRLDGRDEGASRQRQRSWSLAEHRSETVADADQSNGEARSGDRLGTVSRPVHRQPARTSRPMADTDRLVGSTSRQFGMPSGTETRRSINGTERRGGSIGDHWAVEPDVGRVAHGVPHRVDRLRCLGNAVVPQVAEWIGRRILEAAA